MSTTRPKGYHPWRPQQKTQIVLAQVEAVLEEYRPHLPLTARQIFYRIVGAYGYPKTEVAYERLCNYLSRARRARIIPFEALRDDGASVMAHLHHAARTASTDTSAAWVSTSSRTSSPIRLWTYGSTARQPG